MNEKLVEAQTLALTWNTLPLNDLDEGQRPG
jgi:hypothetical protein